MAIYHMTVKTGSRQDGQSASAKCDYIERNGKYARARDPVLHVEHGHMPSFAQDDPRSYWQAADLYERKNGVLFREVEFALPTELDLDQQRLLARQFAERLTADQRMPYTLAIHAGGGTNPHCHLVISERVGDDIERTAAQHFARHNSKSPEKGGTQKADIGSRRGEWLAEARASWAELANSALEQAGHSQRIDHRSLAAQGIDRLPTRHLGPAALGYERRTDEDSRRRLDMRDDRRVVLERLQAAAAAGDELRAATGAWVRSALDVRSFGREREALIERAIAARDALYERYRAGSEPEKNLQLAQAYGLGIKPETAAQAEQLQKQVASRMRSLDEIEAQRAAEAAAPKPTLAELIQQPQRAPEPAPKVDRSGTDLAQLLAQGERVTAPPSPSVAPQAQPEPAPALTFGQHQAVIERRIKERTEAIGREREATATAPARERLQGAQERLKAALPRIENADRQAFSDASRERTAQRGAEAEAEQWRATHWMQTKVGRTGPADELDGRAEGQRSRALVHQRAADEAEARREALAREKRQLEREVEQAERGVEAARQEARRQDKGLDGYTAARRVIDEYRREHPDYAQQADQRAAQERERQAQQETERQAQREQEQGMSR